MDASSSSASTSGESTLETSIGRTTPATSPLFCASLTGQNIDRRLTSLSDFHASDDLSRAQAARKNLPNILEPATAAGIVITNVCFVGAGYVGAPTAAVIALKNPSLNVTVVDRDDFRIRRWNSTHLPISEPGLGNVVRVARDGLKACKISTRSASSSPVSFDGHESLCSSPATSERHDDITIPARRPNLIFTTATSKTIAEADIIFIAVNTPTKMSGLGAGSATDMTALEGSVEEIALHAKTGAIIVEKSTVPCRTAQLIQETLESLRPEARFQVLSNPEFLSEGTAIQNLMHPDRVLIGSSNTVEGRRAAAALVNIYATWIPRSRILGTNVWSSELSKLVANAMLAQRISSINSISAICEQTGADVQEIAKSVGLDPRIGPLFLKAGLGFGGSCFRKDIGNLIYLARSYGLHEVGDYWNQVLVMNDLQRTRFARKVISCLNGTLRGKKITLLGFAFKKNTGDTRESLAIDIIRILVEENPAEIAIYDPGCSSANIQRELDQLTCSPRNRNAVKVCMDVYQACLNSNAILITTDWDKFKTKPSTFVSNDCKLPSPSNTASPPNGSTSSEEPLDSFANLQALQQALAGTSLPSRDQYLPEPECPSDCPECSDTLSGFNLDQDFEWARVLYHMKKPKWVFDGRGVLDVTEMERLGARVEVLGRVGTGSTLA